jgi:hypothetical protein
MPQFDFILYFTMFVIFILYSFILYIIISVFFIPFFWNIFYFRFLKKNYNNFLNFLYFTFNKKLVDNSVNCLLLFNIFYNLSTINLKKKIFKLWSLKLFVENSIFFLLKNRKKKK